MPCSDGGYVEQINNNKIEAMLCAAMGFIENLPRGLGLTQFYNTVDWVEAGVAPHELAEWWQEHKRQDELRRKSARERVAKQIRREAALAKLTDEDRRILEL